MQQKISVAKPILGDEELTNIQEVLDSGDFIQGPYVEEFEEKWASYVGVDHAIAVSNGTVAIQLSLNAIGLEPGDEVILPSLTFGSTATAVVHQGGIPVFGDIDRETYTLDHTDLERCVSDRTVAVMPVHLYGHPAEMDEIIEFAEDHDLTVIEDAAQAHGATYKGDQVGCIGDLGCFSFYATKNITTGEGGVITTNDDELAEQLRVLRNHGMKNRDQHIELGYNYRMSDLNGAIGAAQVDRLPGFNLKRKEVTKRLFNELEDLDWLEPATVRGYVDHAFFWAPFEVKEEIVGKSGKRVWRELGERGIETRHRYTKPLYEQPVFKEHKGFNSEFPWDQNKNNHEYDLELESAEEVAGRTIGLPNHPEISEEDIQQIVKVLRNFNE